MESFHRQIDQGHVKVERHYTTDAMIDVSPGELRQVFTNLISNAIDAMPQGGLLLLEVMEDGQDVKLVFSDTGSGIKKEKLQEIFEPFVTTKGEKGLGIGLWISRNILEKLGGTIQVRSSSEGADHGTQFTVLLPAVQPARNTVNIRRVS
jgi:signal transduction histidine kinase